MEKTAIYWMKRTKDEEKDNEKTNYIIEIPKKRHNEPAVIEAKEKEFENFKKYGAVTEVEDEGQDKIGSQWIINEKQKQDGQKQKVKARIVVRGFQEKKKPQSDSPTALRESFKTFIVIPSNRFSEYLQLIKMWSKNM